MIENNEQSIISPCISVCKTDPLSGYCYGCGRSNKDKTIWKDQDTSNLWKIDNLKILRERLTGWQKDAFDRSYKNKKEKGISLIKQKLVDSKK